MEKVNQLVIKKDSKTYDKVSSVINILLSEGYDIKISGEDEYVVIEFEFADPELAEHFLVWLTLEEYENV